MKFDILFIGNTTYDLIGILREKIQPDYLNELEYCAFSFGGKAANASIYCSGAGAKVSYIGTVGSDFEEIGYKKYLNSHNVNTDFVFTMPNRTPLYVDFHSANDSYSFYNKKNSIEFSFDQLQNHFFNCISANKPKYIYVALSDINLIINIFSFAKNNQIEIIWNPIFYNYDKKNIDTLKSLFDLANYIFINEDENNFLKNELLISELDYKNFKNLKMLCVTLGENGCNIYTPTDLFKIAGQKVTQVIDTTGAGDSFAGSFIGLMLSKPDYNIEQIAEFAIKISANVVSKIGA